MTVIKKFKDLDIGDWFKFADAENNVYNFTYIKISERRYVNAHEYEPRIKVGKQPRKSTIRQVGSINAEVIRQHKGWE